MPDKRLEDVGAPAGSSQQYPLLYAPDRWEWAKADVTFSMDLPPDDLVQSVHAVGFIGDHVVLCQDERPDVWFLPGGTREPDESIDACIRREFAEEAGGVLLSEFHPFGAHVGTSERPRPHREHLPHPRKAWLWGWAEVELLGPPGNPVGGESVTEVRVLPLDEAMVLACTDNAWSGELIALAMSLRMDLRGRRL